MSVCRRSDWPVWGLWWGGEVKGLSGVGGNQLLIDTQQRATFGRSQIQAPDGWGLTRPGAGLRRGRAGSAPTCPVVLCASPTSVVSRILDSCWKSGTSACCPTCHSLRRYADEWWVSGIQFIHIPWAACLLSFFLALTLPLPSFQVTPEVILFNFPSY